MTEEIIHSRYGTAKITHIWRRFIDKARGISKITGVTFEICNDAGRELFNKDRRTLFLNDTLPRCYENNLSNIQVVKDVTA